MDAKERLRLYLEQRRELGEEDLVLDQLPVDDVLSILGVAKGKTSLKSKPRSSAQSSGDSASAASTAQTAPGPRAAPASEAPPAPATPTTSTAEDGAPVAPPPPPAPRFDPNAPASADWRATLSNPDATLSKPDATAAASNSPDLGLAQSSPHPAWLTALELPAGITIGGARDHAGGTTNSDAAAALKKIEETIAACTACILHTTATHPVPGEGNPNADFVCVGEAPGQNEDESGRPFVGPAGQLLNKILGAIELKREDVFICNVLKHRPPGNRNPLPDEVHACRPYLEQQLSVLKPRVILALGTFAAQTLLNTKQSLGALRGQVHLYFGVPLIVTYHPAALLRNEAWKRPTWQDVQLAQRILDASRAANPS